MNSVRWGLLSTANINRRVIPAIRASQRGELVAVASRTAERAGTYAREWDIPLAFDSYESMLESGEIDAVYISLPNHLHAQWTIRSLESGVHVLCEKPFAIRLNEVDAVIEAVEATGHVAAEAFMYRHHPQTKLVGEWVREGRLGEIVNVRGVFNFTVTDPQNIRLIPEWGGGSLWDVGIYPLSFAQYVYGGAPLSVVGNEQRDESGVDTTFVGQLQYEGNRFAQIMSSFRTPFYTYIEIVGTDGRLVLNRPFVGIDSQAKLLFYPPDEDPQEIPVPDQALYLGEVMDMNAAILDGAPNYISLEETRAHVRTALALYQSAEEQRIVHL